MTVSQITGTITAPGTMPNPQVAATSDYQTFLKMLTTQMQNQDPLNPMDSADYAVQLATFSGVEQAVKTNQLLESLQAQFGVLGMAQLAGWVGQEARAEAPAYMDGTAVSIAYTPANAADRAVLVVRDSNDTVVSRENVPLSTETYQWLGAGITGNPLATGKYQLSLESYYKDDLLSTTPVQHYAQILEARGGPGGTTLILRGDVAVAATEISALRVP